MAVIVGFYSSVIFQKELLGHDFVVLAILDFVIFPYPNLSNVYAVKHRDPEEYFFISWDQLQTPIKGNSGFSYSLKHTTMQRCERLLVICLSFYNCPSCFNVFPSPIFTHR